ncbi:MAG: sugar phosphate isomerase/epimerase family protein [Litorilinea sp.]
MSIDNLIDKALALGVDGVELRRELWRNYADELPAVRARLEAEKLHVTYATFSVLFAPDDDAHALLLHDMDTAHALGSPLLRVFPGATPADLNGAGWNRARAAIDHAAGLGLEIALENFSGTPGGTLAEIQHILNTINVPALKTNIDTGNYPLHGQDVVEAIQAIGDRAIYVHLKDYAGKPDGATVALGQGDAPLREILAALAALPQNLLYCFEFGGGEDPDTRIRQAQTFLQQIAAQG